MGSIGEFEKGQQPMLDRIKAHNTEYNKRVEIAWRAQPWWRMVAAVLADWLARIAYK